MRRYVFLLITIFVILISALPAGAAPDTTLVISVRDQKLGVVREGKRIATYPISTSKFGLGDRFGSYRTPIGQMAIASKIGSGLRSGSVLKGRVPTGEILKPNAPGRDPIVTRIMVLRGLEEQNRNANSRGIYIHGTTEEKRIGKPVSYGCIRMRSRDVISVFRMVSVGSPVLISEEKLKTACRSVISTDNGKNVAKTVRVRVAVPHEQSSESS
jgi:lipoprotein-anchoring transpeptidase ErfK/SrfK